MMMICNYNVTNENGALFFDENFCMAEFSMHFEVDPDNWDGEFGHLDFKPEQRTATLFWYGHPEDLSASITTYDLHDFDCGDEVLDAFHNYNLSRLYHAAERFTLKTVNNYLAERERIWREYQERA